MSQPTNEEIAYILDRIADLLEAQDANPFRVMSYRDGAGVVRDTGDSIAEWVESGDEEKLKELPNIGQGLAGVIEEYVDTGRSGLLERLRAEVSPEQVLKQVPGIGDKLAARIATELDVRSLEELEQAAHDGRLEQVKGFGPEKVRDVRVSLAGLLTRAVGGRQARGQDDRGARPSVATLLGVDEEYRRKADAGELKRIAPRRFNPDNEAWLPIMNDEREGWEFTVLYSNTKRAHELDKTHDWVVIYYERDGREGQPTVVTDSDGALAGKRVVRGREVETKEHYEGR
jgi:DNA polymerase (family X)